MKPDCHQVHYYLFDKTSLTFNRMKKILFVTLFVGFVSLSFKDPAHSRKLTEGIVLVQAADSRDGAYVSERDILYDREKGDFDEVSIEGRTAEGEIDGSSVQICPGKGVRCRVIIVYDNEVVAYSGWKKQGSKDVVVSFTEF